jgi:hypothetical protein
MVSSRAHPPSTAGFTLAEMLAALTILLFGVTALLGGMTASVGQRRTTDARHELVALCDYAVHKVQHEAVRATTDSGTPNDLEVAPLVDQPAPGFDGMRWSAKVIADETRPELWLIRIDVRWFDAGNEVTASFVRIVPRQIALRERVAAFRGDSNETTR